MQFIDLNRQIERIRPAIESRINDVLDHGKLILGPEVQELEESLADFCGVTHAIGAGNGTDAPLLALMAAEVGPGDAVFTSAFSFFASAEVISQVGATPIFVDIDAATYNLSPAALAERIDVVRQAGKLTPKAIIAVDLFGVPADYARIEAFAIENDLFLIEDGAQSFGGEVGDRRTGSLGNIATTSFFPAKPLGCFGYGGAVFTSDDDLAAKVRSLRVHGKGKDKYDNIRIGMNSRLDTLQAAILLVKLAQLPQELVARQGIADAYGQRLADEFIVPEIPAGCRSAWAIYTIRLRVKSRETYMRKLVDADVPAAVYYGRPLHLQPAFEDLGGREGQFPATEQCAHTVLSLPIHPYMTSEEIDRVTNALLD